MAPSVKFPLSLTRTDPFTVKPVGANGSENVMDRPEEAAANMIMGDR